MVIPGFADKTLGITDPHNIVKCGNNVCIALTVSKWRRLYASAIPVHSTYRKLIFKATTIFVVQFVRRVFWALKALRKTWFLLRKGTQISITKITLVSSAYAVWVVIVKDIFFIICILSATGRKKQKSALEMKCGWKSLGDIPFSWWFYKKMDFAKANHSEQWGGGGI